MKPTATISVDGMPKVKNHGRGRTGIRQSADCHISADSRKDAEVANSSHVQSLKASSNPESHLKRFDGVENVCECRIGCWRYSGGIGVVDVVILAVQQIQGFDDKAPFFGNSITDLRIEQNRWI